MTLAKIVRVHVTKIRTLFDRWGALRARVKIPPLRDLTSEPKSSFGQFVGTEAAAQAILDPIAPKA